MDVKQIEKAGLLGLSETETADVFGILPDEFRSAEGQTAYRKGQAVGKMQLRTAAFERAVEGDVKCIELMMRFYPEPKEQTEQDLSSEVKRLQQFILDRQDVGNTDEFTEVLQ